MKTEVFGIFASLLTMGTASALDGPAIVQYGALAILGGVVFCLLKGQKEERREFLEAQKEERTKHLNAQEQSQHDFRMSLAGMSKSLDHMATIIAEARHQGS